MQVGLSPTHHAFPPACNPATSSCPVHLHARQHHLQLFFPCVDDQTAPSTVKSSSHSTLRPLGLHGDAHVHSQGQFIAVSNDLLPR